jgi:hypothetical protein
MDFGSFGVVLAVMITFSVSGLWHGAAWTFILFGVFHGIGLSFEFLIRKFRKKMSKTIPSTLYNGVSMLLTFTWAVLAFIIFRSTTFDQAIAIVHKIFTERGNIFWADYKSIAYSLVFIGVLLVVEIFQEYQLFNKFSLYNNNSKLVRQLTYCSLVIIIILFGVFDGSQFIYFQF